MRVRELMTSTSEWGICDLEMIKDCGDLFLVDCSVLLFIFFSIIEVFFPMLISLSVLVLIIDHGFREDGWLERG